MIGLGLKIQNTVALDFSEIPGLLSALEARATFFENESGTITILSAIENIDS